MLTDPNRWSPTIEAYEPSLRAAADAVSRFIADLTAGKPGRWLTLTGACGIGKTLLARQIYEQVKVIRTNQIKSKMEERRGEAERAGQYFDDYVINPTCKWYEAQDFAQHIRSEVANPSGHFHDELPERLGKEFFFLAFDDLGASRDPTGFVADAVSRLCNKRLGKWTVFTTNLTLEEIQNRIDGRVSSRLYRDENEWIKINAQDYALRKRRSSPAQQSYTA